MERICRDCAYFARRFISTYRGGWGECTKLRGTSANTGRQSEIFAWADGTCDDFRPGQEDSAENTSRSSNRERM